MKPVTGANIIFTANTASKKYTKTAIGKDLEASKLYPITVPMTEEFSLSTPLTLEAITAGTITVLSPKSGMKYSKNGRAKTAVPNGTDIVVAAGDKVAFYGDGTSITNYNGTHIAGGTAQVKIYGNIMSLVNETDFATAPTQMASYCFYELFSYYDNLKDASGLLLPATTLVTGCYDAMFVLCYSLTAAPELPATTLARNCYHFMFSGCTSLTTAPELPATTLVGSCYHFMFNGCTSLTTAPELKATSLATGCYYGMFVGCTSLTTAYVKAAYTDSYDECKDMFDGCSAAGAVLHTTTANKDSWDGVMGSGKIWSTWTAVDDWN